MADSGTYDQATILRRQQVADAMLSDAMKPRKIQHWAQGLAQLADAGVGGYLSNKADRDLQTAKDKETADLYGALGVPAPAAKPQDPGMLERIGSLLGMGGTPAPAQAPQAAQPQPSAQPQAAPATGDVSPYSRAIAGIESGGAYDKLGPVTKGDRAFGKYQVMGANIPEWTQAALGKPMTPQEFLASPEAQEAVFKQRFGQYVDKYGPEGAAKAWFAGEKGMNNPNARDVLGTSVSAYADKFNRGLGQQPYQVAGPPTAAPQGGPQVPPVAAAMSGGAPGPAPAPSAAPSAGLLADVPADRKAQIAAMITSSNPTMKALGVQMLGNYTKADQPTDEIREYNLDAAQRKAQGLPPRPFFDYKADLKKAGATNVTVDAGQKVENKFDEKASTLQAERFDKIAQGGNDAKSMMSDIQALRDIGSRITTGKTTEMTAALGPYAEALGVKIDGLDDMQAFKAITSRLAPQMRVPGSGATSDFEMRTFLEGLPGLGKTPGGNELISKTLEAMAQHKIAAAEIASKALNKEITRKDADKMLRELPDPLALWKQTRGEMKPQAAPAAPSKTAPSLPQPGEVRDGNVPAGVDQAALEEARRRGLIK